MEHSLEAIYPSGKIIRLKIVKLAKETPLNYIEKLKIVLAIFLR